MTEDEILARMADIDKRCQDPTEVHPDGTLYVDQERHHILYDELVPEILRSLGLVRAADRYAEAEDKVGWWYS